MSETKRELVIEALSFGQSVEQASELANVSRQTVYNWMSKESFKKELRKRRAEKFETLSNKMITIFESAEIELANLIKSRNESTRLRAVGIALSRTPEILSLTQFENRLTALENKLKGIKR